MESENLIIIRDTREQKGHGWYFDGAITKKLDVGDYSIVGWEDRIFLDRKNSVLELAQNLIDPRFERELERARNHQYKFLMFEFYAEQLTTFPEGVSLPYELRNKLRLKGSFLVKKMWELCIEFGVSPIFAGTAAKQLTKSLFKRILEKE